MIAIVALTLVLGTGALAADLTPSIDSVLAIEYDNGVAPAVLAHGPDHLALAPNFP